MYPMLSVSMDCPFLIAILAFSSVYVLYFLLVSTVIVCTITLYYLYNNVVFSIDYIYGKICTRVKNTVHDPKWSPLCLPRWPTFPMANARYNINIIIILTVSYFLQ